MTNITSECRSANIVRDHATILPDDATPKPDGIFGKDTHLFEMKDGKIVREIAYEMWREEGAPNAVDFIPPGTKEIKFSPPVAVT
jgi:hypothetical protein